MPAGARALDDEAERAGRGVARQAGGEVQRRDDGQEPGDGQVAAGLAEQLGRAAAHGHRRIVGAQALGPHAELDVLAAGQRADDAGDLGGVARADQDVVDAGEHGPEQAEGQGDLDLAQEVDPHRTRVLLLGQPDLAEGTHDSQLLQGDRGRDREARDGPERLVVGLAAVDVVLLHDPQRHRRDREGGQRPAHVPTGIAAHQAPGAHHVEGGAGDDAQLAGLADGVGQLPSGDGHPHPTLDDRREHVLVVHGTTCGRSGLATLP